MDDVIFSQIYRSTGTVEKAMHTESSSSAGSAAADRFRNWKPALLLAIPCLFSSVFSLGDSPAPALSARADRPALVFETYLLHEGLEPVAQQPLLTPFFRFRNKGKEPVFIRELTPACSSCVSPEASATEIPPGGEGRITFGISTRNQPAGLREYLVTVKYNDPNPREVVLTYNVVLPEKQIEVEPKVLMVMGTISAKDRDIVTISDHRPDRTGTPMKFRSVVSSSSLFTVQQAGHSSVDGVNRTALEVTYSDIIPRGQHRGVITVTTDDDTYPTIQIPVILGDRKRPTDDQVSVTPNSARVIVQSSNPAESVGTKVAFTVPARWKISHVDVFPPQLTAQIRTTEPLPPDQSTVTVQVDVSDLPQKGLEQACLTLHAVDGQDPEMVTVPVVLIRR